MRPDNLLGNILWLVFGGFISALGYFFGGLVLCITIIGIPFGLQSFKLGMFMLWPFGQQVVNTESSSGCLTILLNIIWLLCAGIGLAIGHIIIGLLLCLTIIGIPFGRQHFKMIEIALLPFGKEIRPIQS